MEVPHDLAVPAAGSTTARRIVGAYLKRTAQDLFALPFTRFDSRVADDFAVVRGILERMLRAGNPAPLYALLRRPTISTLVRCLDAELRGPGDVRKLDEWLVELTALLAFELTALDLVLDPGFMLHRAPPRLLSLTSSVEIRLPPGCALGFRPGTLVFVRAAEEHRVSIADLSASALPSGVEIRRPFLPVAGELRLTTADNNPLSDVEAHPDKSGNAIDLGDRTPEEWVAALSAAFAIIEEHLPELAKEMRLVMQLLVPVGCDAERHLSASYAESIGTAYLTLHPDLMTMAEALIHESSHNKLNALLRLDPVLSNAHAPLFSSPVRPDPRPLHGVLLAVHAFVPVARLYANMIEAGDPRAASPDFSKRRARIVHQNREGAATLRAHADPTDVGHGVLDELFRWDALEG